jgi:hypothetical protein
MSPIRRRRAGCRRSAGFASDGGSQLGRNAIRSSITIEVQALKMNGVDGWQAGESFYHSEEAIRPRLPHFRTKGFP